ncbi:MAG: hypothetical protein M3Z33_04975 [Actinomycetota bacterium]|nr:hypothetical protein [Actinomycetota bacterium]
MSEAWKSAQDRLRRRIWDARSSGEPEGLAAPTPSMTPVHPPELVSPTIVSPRPVIGAPIRMIKQVLHRLLQPLVFGPQAEFNLRVAAHLNDGERAARQVHDLSARSEADHRRLDGLAQDLEAVRGDVLAVRAELQSQLVAARKPRPEDGEGAAPERDATAPGSE